jgi:hypothetical protein
VRRARKNVCEVPDLYVYKWYFWCCILLLVLPAPKIIEQIDKKLLEFALAGVAERKNAPTAANAINNVRVGKHKQMQPPVAHDPYPSVSMGIIKTIAVACRGGMHILGPVTAAVGNQYTRTSTD